MTDESLLKVALRVLVLEVKKFEDEGVSNGLVGKYNVFKTLLLSTPQR